MACSPWIVTHRNATTGCCLTCAAVPILWFVCVHVMLSVKMYAQMHNMESHDIVSCLIPPHMIWDCSSIQASLVSRSCIRPAPHTMHASSYMHQNDGPFMGDRTCFEVMIVAPVCTCEYPSLQKHKSKRATYAHTIMPCCAVLQVSTNSTW